MTDKVKKSTENYLLVYPKQVKEDIGRAVNTMGFIDKEIPDEDLLTINKDLGDIDSELKSLETSIQDIRSKNKDVVDNLSNSLEYYEKSDELVAKMAKGDKYLYLYGWVPHSKIKDFEKL